MVRARFAPSPTGFLHIGSLRTALYNYLFARKNNGKFLLRIEDTDQTRFVEGAVESLFNTLQQMGIEYDEGPNKGGHHKPYVQSERTDIYRKYTKELIEKNAAYFCFCTKERLDEMREKQTAAKQAPMYDRTCLKLTSAEIEEKKQQGIPYVIRQKIPHGKFLKFKDLIRSSVSFETATIDDQVLMKSDNFPTYHLANVIDDHLMEITHVIRGEEWLPSTPKHILLYEAFGWEKPEFAHIPLLLNKDKSKLSKRQNDVSVESYLQKGYIKEAIINFIALLGWHPGKGVEQEIFSLEELIQAFSLEQVHKAGAIFDIEKLDWFNFQWNKKIFLEQLGEGGNDKRADLLYQRIKDQIPKNWEEKILKRALLTIEEKILKNPREVEQNLKFYFEPSPVTKELICNPKMQITEEIAKNALIESLNALEKLEDYEDLEKIKTTLVRVVENLKLKNGQVFWPARAALTGEQFSPGVFEVIWALGKNETIKRIKEAIKLF